MKATINATGNLQDIGDCYITVPGFGDIILNNLPDISDTKSAQYNDTPVIGRSFPIKTYSHSENRSISIGIHLIVVDRGDINKNLGILRAIESAVYPMKGDGVNPFKPPPVCQIKCGSILGDGELCAVLRTYTVKFPPDVIWDTIGGTLIPYKFDIETQWDVVYTADSLPGQEMILQDGY